jgi:hypothetical protein
MAQLWSVFMVVVFFHAGFRCTKRSHRRGFESNSGIILTRDGVIVINTEQNPCESRNLRTTVRDLTSMPVRLLIDGEPHADHTTGYYSRAPRP